MDKGQLEDDRVYFIDANLGAGGERWSCCYPNAPGCRVIHNQHRSKCGRGLAPDGGVSVDVTLTERLLSGASPLPHLCFVGLAIFQAHNRTGPDTSAGACNDHIRVVGRMNS